MFLKGSKYFCYPSYYKVADSMSIIPHYLDKQRYSKYDFHCVSFHVKVGAISDFTWYDGDRLEA